MMNFKICQIGCGAMSERGHGPALMKYAKDYPGAILAGCCDLDEDRAKSFKSTFGFQKAHKNWRDMVTEINPDAVSLVVPVNVTAEMAVSILDLGYNLITEKPPGMTPGQCMSVMAAQRNSGKKAVAAFNRRYMPIVKALVARISKPVRHIKYDFFRAGRKDADFSTTAIHGIDTVKMISGYNYKEIDIRYQDLDATPVGNIFLSASMEDGGTASLNFYPDAGFTAERATVILDNELFLLNIPVWGCFDLPGSLLHFRNNSIVDKLEGDQSDQFILNGFFDEHRDFYESVRNGLPVPHEIADSYQSVEIMELIRLRKVSL